MSDSPSTSNKAIPGPVAGSGAEKPRANHQRTLQILRAMTPQEKLEQVFKLNERTLNLMRIGLRQRHPDLDEAAFEKLYLKMRIRCHNQRY